MSFAPASAVASRPVRLCGELAAGSVTGLAGRYGARAVAVPAGHPIRSSYWGAPEAGLLARRIYWRADTPAHSLLHELAHFVCMDTPRRRSLDTDAGGDALEECAVCYLEVLLADYLTPYCASRCLADMDSWGYSFREGSAGAWFRSDGREARDWLGARGLIDSRDRPTWRLRE